MPVPPPTPRLRFREFTGADLDAMAELLGDPRVMVHYGMTYDRAGAERWITRQLERYDADGHGLWVIESHAGEFLGDCGLTYQWTDRGDVLEVGYHLFPRHQGNGYATEAAAACRDWAADELDAPRLHAIVARANEPSHAVARRIGLTDERPFRGRMGDDLILHSGPTRPPAADAADWGR